MYLGYMRAEDQLYAHSLPRGKFFIFRPSKQWEPGSHVGLGAELDDTQ